MSDLTLGEVAAFMADQPVDAKRIKGTVAGSSGTLDYAAITTDATATATTEGTANTIVSGNTVTLDGATDVVVEFFCDSWQESANATTTVVLFDGATVLGNIYKTTTFAGSGNAAPPIYTRTPLSSGDASPLGTPAAGDHQYIVKAYVTTGTATFRAGAGGTGTAVPAYVRVVSA